MGRMSSFFKTRHFPTLSSSNKMKSFESYPSCVGEVPATCRFERKARLRLSVRVCITNSVVNTANEVLVESPSLFSCYFQNSTFDLNTFCIRPSKKRLQTLETAFTFPKMQQMNKAPTLKTAAPVHLFRIRQ